jgi:chromosome segregation ATPase
VDERVAGALSGMESRGAEADAEAASRLSELAGSHEQLNSAVERLAGQVSAARADLGGRTSQEQEQASRVEHHLGDLKELLAGVAARIDNEVEPVLAALQQREQDARVEQGLAAGWKAAGRRPTPKPRPGCRNWPAVTSSSTAP